jgi:hypothetical protein
MRGANLADRAVAVVRVRDAPGAAGVDARLPHDGVLAVPPHAPARLLADRAPPEPARGRDGP